MSQDPAGDSSTQPPNPPQLIIDDDWKREAQAEKARLVEQDKAKQAQAAEQAEGQAPAGFEDLVKMFASQAMMYLGYIPDPQTGKAIVAPEYARMNIDFLGVLAEKTKGNLDEAETELLTTMLTELRTAFVEVSKAVAQAVQEGKISPSDLGGPMQAAPPPPPSPLA